MQNDSRELRILAVDDDPFTLKLLRSQLSKLGLEAITCERAEEALKQLFSDDTVSVGLVISDLQMPGMDGIEFVRHLVDRGYMGHLLLLSGEDERTVEAAALLANSQRLKLLGTLRKPLQLQQLKQHLERIIPQEPQPTRSARKSYPPDQLERAIAQGELINHYQPKVALIDGALIGVESLVRWQHPVDGLVYPDQFIAVAEENNLIDSLTDLVLRNALTQVGRWEALGLRPQVAVNVSMKNLCALEFPEVVARYLAETRVSPEKLIIEVTESKLMQDLVMPLDILTRLRLKRVKLSIDDFGTGHSSLTQLRDLPFDELKLDMSFVHGAHSAPRRRAILEASLAMARQLGMKTVAEGVEDRDDWDCLRRMGCDLAQGYFCAKPMDGDALSAWNAQWMTVCEQYTGDR